MSQNRFPPGWDEKRVARVFAHYKKQSDEAAVKEDESAFKGKNRAVIEVPQELMPVIGEVLGQYPARAKV